MIEIIKAARSIGIFGPLDGGCREEIARCCSFNREYWATAISFALNCLESESKHPESKHPESKHPGVLPSGSKHPGGLRRTHRLTTQYLSSRLIPLLYWGPVPPVPTLTMECYSKWYDCHLVHPDGRVETVDWVILEDLSGSGETAWRDHAPNPEVVRRLCAVKGWSLCELAEEMLEARFGE